MSVYLYGSHWISLMPEDELDCGWYWYISESNILICSDLLHSVLYKDSSVFAILYPPQYTLQIWPKTHNANDIFNSFLINLRLLAPIKTDTNFFLGIFWYFLEIPCLLRKLNWLLPLLMHVSDVSSCFITIFWGILKTKKLTQLLKVFPANFDMVVCDTSCKFLTMVFHSSC